MSQCLYAYSNPNYDDVVWQAAQLSTISIMNFSVRIFIGEYCSVLRSLILCILVLSLYRLSIRLYEEQVWHSTLVLSYISCCYVFHFSSCNGHHRRYRPSVDCECFTRSFLWECLLPILWFGMLPHPSFFPNIDMLSH